MIFNGLTDTSSTCYLKGHFPGVSHTQQVAPLLPELLPPALFCIYFVNFYMLFLFEHDCGDHSDSVLYFQAVHNMDEFMFGK